MTWMEVISFAIAGFAAGSGAAYLFAGVRWGSNAEARKENVIFAVVVGGFAAWLAVGWFAANSVNSARRVGLAEASVFRSVGEGQL